MSINPSGSQGVLKEHHDRMANEPAYKTATLTAPAHVRGKYLTNTAPTTGKANRTATANAAKRSTTQRARPSD
jgi:hypothetical protein